MAIGGFWISVLGWIKIIYNLISYEKKYIFMFVALQFKLASKFNKPKILVGHDSILKTQKKLKRMIDKIRWIFLPCGGK